MSRMKRCAVKMKGLMRSSLWKEITTMSTPRRSSRSAISTAMGATIPSWRPVLPGISRVAEKSPGDFCRRTAPNACRRFASATSTETGALTSSPVSGITGGFHATAQRDGASSTLRVSRSRNFASEISTATAAPTCSYATGAEWKVSYGGTSPWQHLNTSQYVVDDLGFGDFDGNGRTDVFGIRGGKWSVVWNGTNSWTTLNDPLSTDVEGLVFADFNGDGKTDIGQSRYHTLVTQEWRVSWSGKSYWQRLRLAPTGAQSSPFEVGQYASFAEHFLGNFDTVPGVDALRFEDGVGRMLERSSGCASANTHHSRGAMR